MNKATTAIARKPGRPTNLTPEQVSEMKLLFPNTANAALAELFKITVKQVRKIGTHYGWTKANWEWKEEHKRYIKDHYFSHPRLLTAQQIANDLGREYWGVVRMIRIIRKELVINDHGE